MKLIKLKCSNCGAELQIDMEGKQAFCSYCGSRLLIDDDTIHITKHIVDEARLKEAEVRLKELEYAHEREMRAREREFRHEELQREQKKSFRLSLLVFLLALVITYSVPGLRSVFVLVLIFGGISLAGMQSDERRNRSNDIWINYSPKSRLAALIICLFFGVFGVHYFYVGKIGTGILYLLTLGFFGIGWFIDLIRIACGIFKDKNGYYLRA